MKARIKRSESLSSDRLSIKIPKDSELYRYLQNNNHKMPQWKVLEGIIKQIPKSNEEKFIALFDRFIEDITILYPDIKKKIEFLRPLLIKQFLNGNRLDDWYYEDLKKL